MNTKDAKTTKTDDQIATIDTAALDSVTGGCGACGNEGEDCLFGGKRARETGTPAR